MAPTISAETMAKAPVKNTAREGVIRLGSMYPSELGSSSSLPIVLRMREMPLAELIITANMLDTEAMITGHFIQEAYIEASVVHGASEPVSALVALGPRPRTSAQMQNT